MGSKVTCLSTLHFQFSTFHFQFLLDCHCFHEFGRGTIIYQKKYLSSPTNYLYPQMYGDQQRSELNPNSKLCTKVCIAMKKYFLIITLLSSLELAAQKNLLFDTSKIDSHTKLIGRYDQIDRQKKFYFLNFIIEDPAKIKKVLASSLALGAEIKSDYTNMDFRIDLIQDYRKTQSWMINPDMNCVLVNDNFYTINIDKIKALADKNPFDYKFEALTFNTQKEYDEYLTKQKKDDFFLFAYASSFAFEGTFEMQFPRNNKYPSPTAIHDTLAPQIEKYVPKGKYSFSYILDDRNLANPKQFIITIYGTRELYDNLHVENLKPNNWKQNVAKGYFFYRTR